MDAASLDYEVDIVVGNHSRVALGDAAHAHGRRGLTVECVAARGQRDPPGSSADEPPATYTPGSTVIEPDSIPSTAAFTASWISADRLPNVFSQTPT